MAPRRQREIAIDGSRATGRARTGTEWYSFELIGSLIELSDRPPLTVYHRSARDVLPHGKHVRHRYINVPRLWTHLGLSYAMLRDRPAALFVPSHVVPLLHPAASVVTVHDLGYLEEREAHPTTSRAILDITTRWNAYAAKRVIAVSGQTQEDLIQRYGTRPRKITVVHSGVNHHRFRPLDPRVVHDRLAALGIRQPYLLFLGTIQPRKNLDRLLDAFEALNDQDLLLVIGGKSGWLSTEIEQRITALANRGSVVWLGYVADVDVPILYNGARAFVLPSLYEGFGMPVLEAMACGCPVVTSNRSSLPEVAGDAAELVDPLDPGSIRTGIVVALEPGMRDRLVQLGMKRAAAFTWERTARETLRVILGAMHEQRSTG